jgi:hypothetical protein
MALMKFSIISRDFLEFLNTGAQAMSSVTDQAELEMITEGKAAVFFPKGQVFYNRVQVSARMRRLLNISVNTGDLHGQVQNRDLSVASLRVFTT